MSLREEFYQQRDSRTREYGIKDNFLERPVILAIGDGVAATRSGQLAFLSLLNLAVRLHRRVCLSVPSVPLIAKSALLPGVCFDGLTLDEAATALALRVNPFVEFSDRPSRVKFGIGIGATTDDPPPINVGWTDNIGCVGPYPQHTDRTTKSCFGPELAACLGAWALFCQVLERPVPQQRISAWNWRVNSKADPGPSELPTLDIGRVLLVGAGAVGSCASFWLRQVRIEGQWLVVDDDDVELHNTNRSLAFSPADAGWPGAPPTKKAVISAEVFGGTPKCCWYSDLSERDLAADIVLCLANQGGVRSSVSQRGDPIVLHATTSRHFEAQLHRHIVGRDDCIVCRVPDRDPNPEFPCSTATVLNDTGGTDAALPFLSATAGLMLVSSLFRLQAGELPSDHFNGWRMSFQAHAHLASGGTHKCKLSCPGSVPPRARAVAQRVNRWAYLDSGKAS